MKTNDRTTYCENDPCEAEACVLAVWGEEGKMLLCYTCAQAFEFGMTVPARTYDLDSYDEGEERDDGTPNSECTITIKIEYGCVQDVIGMPNGWLYQLDDRDNCHTCGTLDPDCPDCGGENAE